MNFHSRVWGKRIAFPIVVMLVAITNNAFGADSSTSEATSPDNARSIGPFSLSVGSFWTTERADRQQLTLVPSSGDTANSLLMIQAIELNARQSASARSAMLNYLCEQISSPSQPCEQRRRNSAKLASQWQLVQGKSTNGYDVWLGQRRQMVAQTPTQFVTLILNSGAHLLAMTLSSERSKTKMLARYNAQRALGDLVGTVTVNADKTLSPEDRWQTAGVPGAGSLKGFYATIGGSQSQKTFSAHRTTMGISGLRLTSDGRFVLGERELDQPIDAVCRKLKTFCGRYALDADRITTWRSRNEFERRVAFMQRQVWSFTRESEHALLIGGERHVRVETPDARLLAGRFRSALRTGERYSETVFSFTEDGEFTESGFTATSGQSGTPISLSSAQAGREGQFEVDGFTLVLNYSDDSSERLSLFFMGDVPVIEGSMYQRLREPTSPQ